MSYPAVVTFWYVGTANPAAVLEAEPKADRGFGRKLLSQLNPRWPITPIGQFPLNRSTKPSRAEFYIAGYPGVAVLQTFVEDCGKLSDISPDLLAAVPADDVFVFAEGTGDGAGFGGFAHFHGEEVSRSLCATRTALMEDLGLPEPFEAPYWAGERAEQIGGISLPFEPVDLMHAAETAWLGVDVSPDGPDINVVGYAVDGRPEPKVEPRKPETKNVAEVAAKFSSPSADYDDYEETADDEQGGEFAQFADASAAAARRIGRGLKRRWRDLKDAVVERIRHSDR
ncbi:hypothetical protein [Corynebacterium sp. Marseille-P3884]|uniref:DUF6928 family protein n=1 Tax=Corynebacterium sp. Marseille-P3884 TaxID=2495409 RepID=UPI001B32BD7E|nr:hypothetical protein [Corynebacterium sp. Marseille-P3884]MBP3949349.1 hypothetical protein [Corynebacterium sp. Marseille-P3884]